MYINHRGLNRFHRGHMAYIPYILTLVYIWYIGRVTSMKAWYIGRMTSMKVIQAPVILIIKRIIQLGQAMIKITFYYF